MFTLKDVLNNRDVLFQIRDVLAELRENNVDDEDFDNEEDFLDAYKSEILSATTSPLEILEAASNDFTEEQIRIVVMAMYIGRILLDDSIDYIPVDKRESVFSNIESNIYVGKNRESNVSILIEKTPSVDYINKFILVFSI